VRFYRSTDLSSAKIVKAEPIPSPD